MKIYKTKFKDLLIIKQKNNIDLRGSLRETFNKKIHLDNFLPNKTTKLVFPLILSEL